MTERTSAGGWLAVAIAMAIAGCSSSDGEAPATGPSGPYAPPGNGTIQSEADACAALTQALSKTSSRLGCAWTFDTCPNYLRKLVPTHDCRDWDQGSVDACAAWVGGYASCDDLAGKPFAPAYMSSQSQCK